MRIILVRPPFKRKPKRFFLSKTVTIHTPLTAEFGSYALTGQTANLYKGFYLLSSQGSYTLTGQTSNLITARLLALAQGAYTLTGQNTNLLRGYPLTAVQGTYTLTGQEAGLIYSGALAPLNAASGSFTLTGNTTNLLYGKRLVSSVGSYTLTGNNTNLLFGRLLGLGVGSYTLTGNTTNPFKGFLVTSSPGSFSLTGNTVSFLVTRFLSLEVGTYTLTGRAAGLTVSAQEHHPLSGVLRWSDTRLQTMLIGNDNVVWLAGVVDRLDPINTNGTPKYLNACDVTWEIKDAEYPNGLLLAQGTAIALGTGGEYSIQIDESIVNALEVNEAYWLNVYFTDPDTGYEGTISTRFLTRVRTGRTVGT